jgi:hypothetical protein
MGNRRLPFLRPIVPCTFLGAALGLLLPNPLNSTDAKVIGDVLVGAVFGFLVGYVLDEVAGGESSPKRLIPRRFSLGGLFVVTTVIALVLGLFVAMLRGS